MNKIKTYLLIVVIFFNFFISFAQDCQWDRFNVDTDITNTNGKLLADAIDDNPGIINSWWVFDKLGEVSLRTNLDELKWVDNYLTTNSKTSEVLVEEVSIVSGGYDVWKLANTEGSFATVTKAIVKQQLPTDFLNALKKFGKTVDEILDYFKNYHNDNGLKFFNEIEELLKNYPTITKAEANVIWGYTTNFFYWDLNNWLRNSKNLSKLSDLKNILGGAISKMPKYNGIAYRAIKLDGDALSKFLLEHKIGETVEYKDFVSCGSTQKAAFFDRPDKNVRLIMEVENAPNISDFADGIKFRGYERSELLLNSNSKFIVKNHELVDGVYYINIKQIP